VRSRSHAIEIFFTLLKLLITGDQCAGAPEQMPLFPWLRLLTWNCMNRVIRQIAKNSSVTPAKAADQVDKVVHRLLQKLRKGEAAPLPGVGVLSPGPGIQFLQEIHGNDTASRNRRQRS
jgi:hypothetical protein